MFGYGSGWSCLLNLSVLVRCATDVETGAKGSMVRTFVFGAGVSRYPNALRLQGTIEL